MIAETDLN